MTKEDIEELFDLVLDLVIQGCSIKDGMLDSMAISTYADALRFLAKHGYVTIVEEAGDRILAKVGGRQ